MKKFLFSSRLYFTFIATYLIYTLHCSRGFSWKRFFPLCSLLRFICEIIFPSIPPPSFDIWHLGGRQVAALRVVFVAVAIHQREAPPLELGGVGEKYMLRYMLGHGHTHAKRPGKEKNEAHRRGRMCFLHKYLSSISVQKLSVNQWCNLAQTNKRRMHFIEAWFWHANHRLVQELFLPMPVPAVDARRADFCRFSLSLHGRLVSTYQGFICSFFSSNHEVA